MARPLRIAISDGTYHVMARGNGRQPIFLDDRDRQTFLDLFEEVVRRFGWHCLAYCLMRSHYHLVVRTPMPNLSQGMRQLNGVYAQRFNRQHDTCGHVFQGRFRCTLVDTENYLFELVRYVALNPVSAGMCKEPVDWPWSSHRALIGVAKDSLVDANELLRYFGSSLSSARGDYQLFIQQGGGTWSLDECAPAIGSAEFLDTHLPDKPPSQEISRNPWQQNRLPLNDIFDHHPLDEAINVAYVKYGYRLCEIAEVIGCHYSTVSRRLRRFESGRNEQL